MPSPRSCLALAACVALLGLLGAPGLWIPDPSWTSGYFDDQDADLGLWMIGEGSSALTPGGAAPPVVLTALASLVLCGPSALSLLAPRASNLRAPPGR